MAAPYSSQSSTGYNSNPPSDDGSHTSNNQMKWSGVKAKLSDPIKTLADAINAAIVSAFGKTLGSSGITNTSISYGVQGSDQGKVVRATSSGITITTPDATSIGAPFSFSLLNNSTASITLAGSNPGVQQNVDGAASISIPSGAGLTIETDGTNWFTHGQNFIGTQVMPQGRLTLTSATPVLSTDVTAATSVYYTPYIGNLVPIYNGTIVAMRQFSELTLTLQSNSNYAASAIYDIFVFDSSGAVTIGIGPAWSAASAGTGARGTGAGTTELQRFNGILTNKNSMTARNAASTYTVAANQGTYVGSIAMDATNGQVSCHVSFGQSRKWGIWNAYNRSRIILQGGDSTASWGYSTNTIRQSNAATGNTLAVFCGLAEEYIQNSFLQAVSESTGADTRPEIGIGWNSTTAISGTAGQAHGAGSGGQVLTVRAEYDVAPALGINNVNSLENGAATGGVFYGGQSHMLLKSAYSG